MGEIIIICVVAVLFLVDFLVYFVKGNVNTYQNINELIENSLESIKKSCNLMNFLLDNKKKIWFNSLNHIDDSYTNKYTKQNGNFIDCEESIGNYLRMDGVKCNIDCINDQKKEIQKNINIMSRMNNKKVSKIIDLLNDILKDIDNAEKLTKEKSSLDYRTFVLEKKRLLNTIERKSLEISTQI